MSNAHTPAMRIEANEIRRIRRIAQAQGYMLEKSRVRTVGHPLYDTFRLRGVLGGPQSGAVFTNWAYDGWTTLDAVMKFLSERGTSTKRTR